jgi:hypothetical protein
MNPGEKLDLSILAIVLLVNVLAWIHAFRRGSK